MSNLKLDIDNFDWNEYKWNVRRLDNKVQIELARSQNNIYVSINDLINGKWEHRISSTVSFGNNFRSALVHAQNLYDNIK